MMSAEQVHLLRKSFLAIEPQAHVAALVFYRNLFRLNPSLRPLFKVGIEEQARKLMDMLSLALALLARPEALETELRELGARHRTYGVRDEHYETVGQALLQMLGDVLGSEFTPATHEAWAKFYGLMAETMKTSKGEIRNSNEISMRGAKQARAR